MKCFFFLSLMDEMKYPSLLPVAKLQKNPTDLTLQRLEVSEDGLKLKSIVWVLFQIKEEEKTKLAGISRSHTFESTQYEYEGKHLKTD